MTQVNSDPGDETDHKEEQCEEKVSSYGEEERCRYPKGHEGPHGLWYYQPEALW